MIFKTLLQKKLTWIIFGFIISIIIIWLRFIRERLPKDLPLILHDKLLIIITFSCFMLLYALIVLLLKFYHKPLTNNMSLNLILNSMLKKSLYEFDNACKIYFQQYLNIQNLFIILFNFFYKYKIYKVYIYIFFFLPKIIVPIILFLEVFYFHHIEFFYKVLFLMLFPLLYNYIFYSLHSFYIQQIEAMDCYFTFYIIKQNENNEDYLEEITSYASHFYIQEHALDRLNIRKNNTQFHITLNSNFINTTFKNKTLREQELFFNINFKNSFFATTKMYDVLYNYNIIDKKFSFYFNFFMLCIHLICWFHILITSHVILSDTFYFLLKSFQYLEDPFSQNLM